jgi:hypothetical protein
MRLPGIPLAIRGHRSNNLTQGMLSAPLPYFAGDSAGRTIWIADAHRDDGKRFVGRADEKLTSG